MGYHTDFYGEFNLDKPLTQAQKNYLNAFASTRRMARKQSIASKLDDPLRIAVQLPIGKEGGYFVGGKGHAGQDEDDSITEYNNPPRGQPSLWCQWVPSDDGTTIVWDGGEKFYEYTAWIEYLIEHFLKPWGYVLSGEVEWQGEERDDRGMIVVDNNVVKIKVARITYQEI